MTIPRDQAQDLEHELRKALQYAAVLVDIQSGGTRRAAEREWEQACSHYLAESLERIEAIRSALPQEITCPVR